MCFGSSRSFLGCLQEVDLVCRGDGGRSLKRTCTREKGNTSHRIIYATPTLGYALAELGLQLSFLRLSGPGVESKFLIIKFLIHVTVL